MSLVCGACEETLIGGAGLGPSRKIPPQTRKLHLQRCSVVLLCENECKENCELLMGASCQASAALRSALGALVVLGFFVTRRIHHTG